MNYLLPIGCKQIPARSPKFIVSLRKKILDASDEWMDKIRDAASDCIAKHKIAHDNMEWVKLL